MNNIFGNVYSLELDIKNSNMSIIPKFTRYDTNVLRFRVLDDGTLIDFDLITHAEVTVYRGTDEAVFKRGVLLIEDGGEKWFQYVLQEEENGKLGKLTVIATIYQGNSLVSTRPIYIHIEDEHQTDFKGVMIKDVTTLKNYIEMTQMATQKAYESSIHIEQQTGNIEELKADVDKTVMLTNRIKTSTEIFDELVEKLEEEESMPIDLLKYYRIMKLKEECTNSIHNGFFFGENWFGFNQHDQDNMTQQLLMIVMQLSQNIAPEYITWKTKNNGIVSMSANEFLAVTMQAETFKRNEQWKYWNIEQLIYSATTKEEILSIEWDDFDATSF